MVVLQHEHSLCLIDLNPSYPHVEEAYDDEEDLIIKQAFQCLCDRCDKKITYVHRYYYKCEQCDYSLHKLCEHLPTTLEHASHRAHNLTLFLDKSKGKCHECKSIWYEQLCYHCSTCKFSICLNCGMNDIQYHTLYHPSHQHPLIPLCRQRKLSAECDACGETHTGVFYDCPTCFQSCIHTNCVFQLKRLSIQDGTRGRFVHTHPLILTYSFPKGYQKAKFDPRCRVCDNAFSDSDNENIWVYKCEKCRYYVHLRCANSNSGIDVPSSSYNAEDGNVLHLPLPNKTFEMLEQFFLKETNMGSITHNFHKHYPLSRVKLTEGIEICNGCVRPIEPTTFFYKCQYVASGYSCDFSLHEWCTRFPRELNDYKGHPQHTLILKPQARYNTLGVFKCNACSRLCNGFAYSCVKCEYNVDVTCAFIQPKIIHKSHPHHPLSRVEERKDKNYCRICLSEFESGNKETSLSCELCNFHLHFACAVFLPETIKHKYDKHPMTLCYGPVENHEGDYFCEVCEEELNPNGCFYHCHQCMQSIHTVCAPLIPQNQRDAYTHKLGGGQEYGRIKFPPRGSFIINKHDHPFSFLQGSAHDGSCLICERKLEDNDLILKCVKCMFGFHYYHLGMKRVQGEAAYIVVSPDGVEIPLTRWKDPHGKTPFMKKFNLHRAHVAMGLTGTEDMSSL